jgi:monoamine oxidase
VKADVIVIGAGAAGLAAAAHLTRAGKRVLLLEARDRIGGRIWTRREPHLACPIELGAEFIHGHAPLTRALLAGAGIAGIDASPQRWVLQDGELRQADDWFAGVIEALSASRALEKADMSFDEFLERHLTQLTPEQRAGARRMAEGFDAADTARASARALVSEWTGDALSDSPQSRPQGGYAGLLEALMEQMDAPRLTLRLQCPVTQVHWSRGSVKVRARLLGQPVEMTAPRAIVTLPLALLQDSAAVSFSPPLGDKRSALAGLATGSVIKVLLRFSEAFWENLAGGRYRDASFFIAPGTPLPTFWTPAPLRAPLLVAWTAGPRALALSGGAGDGAHLVAPILAGLESLFGPAARIAELLEGYYCHDWQHDPYARGAYSYVLAGGAQARAALARPLQETLFFAGEATDTQDESGTVAGALASGTRAADELLRSRPAR